MYRGSNRPISVVCTIAKVFERIVYDQLYSFLSANGKISKEQSGFRAMHSTLTALVEATDSWSYEIDRGNVNAIVFLDLKKAFDTVDHEILLAKLCTYGIRGDELAWFRSYLENRTQQCLVNGSLSELCTLQCGVPQGTILGPLLFLMYINDLPNCINHSKSRMYADDTHLTYVDNDATSIQTCLNADLRDVNRWLTNNKLTLNMTKTEFLLIGSRQKLATLAAPPVIESNGLPIKQVNSTTSLGVTIDCNLSWKEHIEKLSRKIASAIGALKRIRPFVHQSILHLIFKSLVQPHFEYCNIVWGNCGKTLLDKLQKLQNRAARVLTFSNYDANAEELIEKLGWSTIKVQIQKQKAILTFKALHGLTPEYLSSHFTERCESGYWLRDSDKKLNVPIPRTNYLKNTFRYSAAMIWNTLPNNLKEAESLSEFRQLLNSFYNK